MRRKSAATGSTSPCKGEVGREAAGRGSPSASRFSRTCGMTSKARALRKEMTKVESKLWNMLRRDQLPEIRLALELDGGQHGFDDTRARDRRRTKWLASRGITVLRFWNNDVIENLEGVWSEIARVLNSLRSHSVTPSLPLPLSGGGKEYASRQEPND